jgi:hypothetical protein
MQTECAFFMMNAFRLLLLAGSLTTAAFAEDPWSVEPAHPAIAKHPPASSPDPSTAGLIARGWLTFYQQWLGVLMQSNCRMAPSCSNYSIEAIRKHGAAVGIVMTADRLLHEGDEQIAQRYIRSAGFAYCPDPVSNNDFWWHTHD